ncbi:TfoX/Sxy family protein [Luteimonas saliphila]|uniref:TfoX/Sxy family protein n=1 Tax=Luteimonas saliphila TaxID=2804919 RepID=UPI00192DB87A|nr:TfoX/Sxy family protein [Luteimonas saliphila]
MSTDTDFIEYVHEQAALGPRLSHKRMFGEYALYLDGKVVAFACDNSLLLKPTQEGRAVLPSVTLGKPYPEAKDYFVLDEFLDDTELLRRALQATAEVLPAPKPKTPGKASKSVQRTRGRKRGADDNAT